MHCWDYICACPALRHILHICNCPAFVDVNIIVQMETELLKEKSKQLQKPLLLKKWPKGHTIVPEMP